MVFETPSAKAGELVSRVSRVQCFPGNRWQCQPPTTQLHITIDGRQVSIPEPVGIDDETVLGILTFLAYGCDPGPKPPARIDTVTSIRRKDDAYEVWTAHPPRRDEGSTLYLRRLNEPSSSCKWTIERVRYWEV